MKLLTLISFFIYSTFCGISGQAQEKQRFPMPEFDNGHVPPDTHTPMPSGVLFEYLDVIVLLLLLIAATWFVIKRRSRTGVVAISILSILYFGFYKYGCICPVGSVQNITLSVFQSTYVIPFSTVLVFSLPLLFALFFGRVFCSGVCLFGAIQELIIFKKYKVPSWLEKSLGIIPYLYLSLAILFAATDSDFIICRFDPFVGFFRQSAYFHMFVFGVIILITGVFISRPYCRFFCPYGVLLGWFSRVSKWHLYITPKECISCKLCENSCPVNAINLPVEKPSSAEVSKGARRLVVVVLLIPFLAFAGGFITSGFHKPMSQMNSTVSLAEEISQELKTGKKSLSIDVSTFNASGTSIPELFDSAKQIQKNFYIGSWIIGVFLGLLLAFALLDLSVFKQKTVYDPNRASCVSCARCFKYCPVDKVNFIEKNTDVNQEYR